MCIMNTVVYCKINGKKLKITNNSVEIEDSFLQVELVKKLIECKSITPPGESSLPLLFNKHLRNYKISDVVFCEAKSNPVFEMDFEETYIDDMVAGIAA
ncbi:MAG: hypothetical protein CMP63_02470 [Flavobacteriales bacterium]|nr:hypothetical protein [Flavobacteriales bacterium]